MLARVNEEEYKYNGDIKNNIRNAGVVKEQKRGVKNHMLCSHNGIPASRAHLPDGKRKTPMP